MKDLFIFWIVYQLLFIGVTSVQIHNGIVNDKYNCSVSEEVPEWLGLVIPLAAFVPISDVEYNYCFNQSIK